MTDLPDISALGGLDMNSLLSQAMEMQQKMMEAQASAAATTFEGASGGGVVRVEMSGTGEIQRFHIDPKAVDVSDISMLEDLLLAAVHDAAARVAELQSETMGGLGLNGLTGH